MPTFDTPEPISLTLELGVGDVRIVASDRDDTIVDVQPSDPAKKADVTAAEQTRVEYANGTLLVKAPKGGASGRRGAAHESIDVRIELPTGSTVRGVGGGRGPALHRTDRRVPVPDGRRGHRARADRPGGAQGRRRRRDGGRDRRQGRDQDGRRTSGSAGSTGRPRSRTRTATRGSARSRARRGSTRPTARSPSTSRASGVVAKTANGDVRLDEVAGGSVVAQSAFGSVEIGVADGVPAWLDLETKFGHVRNDLDDAERPEAGGGRRRGPRPHLHGRHHGPPLVREQHAGGRAMTATARPPALEATGLRKSFGDTVALDGIDLNVPEGSIFALLGPNGAGKTTTVQILSTLIRADAGRGPRRRDTIRRASRTRCAR